LKSVFPSFNRFQNEGDMKKEIITKIIDDVPELVSIDIVNTFREIQIA
jgi:hypothetical protein